MEEGGGAGWGVYIGVTVIDLPAEDGCEGLLGRTLIPWQGQGFCGVIAKGGSEV